MATHSSILAWRIPGTGEPGGLPSMGVTQSRTRLTRLSSSSNEAVHISELWAVLGFWVEKAVAPHSSTLAWKIPWTEEPGGLQSMGSLRIGHDWVSSLSLFTFMPWRRKWQPTPVFLPGESRGQRSLVGCHLWGCTVRHDWSDAAAAAGFWKFCFS